MSKHVVSYICLTSYVHVRIIVQNFEKFLKIVIFANLGTI